MKKLIMFVMVLMLCLGTAARAQYDDYVGAGHADDIVATASSEDWDSPTEGAWAINSVNGSGLDVTGVFHDQEWDTTWTSLELFEAAANPNPARGSGKQWIHYDLGHVYRLGLMHVWNDNEATWRSLEDVTIDYSVDGTNWTELGSFTGWPEAPGSDTYEGFEGPDFGGVSARYVLITVDASYDTEEEWAGLSEIKIEAGAAGGSPIAVDPNITTIYEPQDPEEDGPEPLGPVVGNFGVKLGWRPGEDPCNLGTYFSDVTVTVTLDPNTKGDKDHDDYFIWGGDPDGDGSITLVFDANNYDILQKVHIEAIKDNDREGDENYELGFTSACAEDPNFEGAENTMRVTVVDNDIRFVWTSPSLIELSESHVPPDPCGTECFEVRLSLKPADTVYVLVEAGEWAFEEEMFIIDPNFEDWTDPNRLTFTATTGQGWTESTMTSGWNVEQTICVHAQDNDWVTEPWTTNIDGEISLTPYSNDLEYSVDWLEADPYGFPLDVEDSGGTAEEAFVTVIVEDNDCGALGYDIADVTGGEDGEPDCIVNLADFAVFFSQWLSCTNPYDDPEYGEWGDCDALWNLVEEE